MLPEEILVEHVPEVGQKLLGTETIVQHQNVVAARVVDQIAIFVDLPIAQEFFPEADFKVGFFEELGGLSRSVGLQEENRQLPGCLRTGRGPREQLQQRAIQPLRRRGRCRRDLQLFFFPGPAVDVEQGNIINVESPPEPQPSGGLEENRSPGQKLRMFFGSPKINETQFQSLFYSRRD